MNGYRRTGYAAMLAFMFVLPGCLDLGVDTTVNPDGSSDRTISMGLQSKTVPAEAFPRPSGEGWKIDWSQDTGRGGGYTYTASKHFATPEDLMREYNESSDTSVMRVGISLSKRFEWFYTYYEYRELYGKKHPPYRVPVSAYLTDEELRRYSRGEENDSLTAKLKRWEDRNLFEAVYDAMAAAAEQLRDPALPVSLLAQHKEELASLVQEKKPEEDSTETQPGGKKRDDVAEALQKMAAILKTQAVFRLRPAIDTAIVHIVEADAKYKTPDSWNCTLRMPGLLVETDGTGVEGNRISWKFKTGQLRFGEYEMNAVSRVANGWAFILTGLGLLVLLVAGFFRFRRRADVRMGM